MKKKIVSFSALFLISFNTVYGQVGIGTTTPDQSSILHLNSTNKGLLLTSIALTSSTDNTTIPSPAAGLLIWNNGTGGFSPAGLYYWDNAKWNILSTGLTTTGIGTTSGWNTTGNNSGSSSGAGTAMSLGTSTFDDLIFKVNNTYAGRLGTNNSVQLGTGTSASQSGTAVGQNAKSTSNESTAVGANSTAAGFQSAAFGYNSKTNSNSETAIGYNTVTNGQNSTALGSGASATGQNSSAIGYGAATTQANAIVLGNSGANIGIGTNSPNTSAKLDVNGQFKLGEKGSIIRNIVSFETWPGVSINNLSAGGSAEIDIAVPAAAQISSGRASIVVSPAGDFPGNSTFAVSNPRYTSASNIRINVTNISGAAASLYYGHFFVTVNEF
ncbi:hypothetical protein [Chryseobacterium caseinilyticum]|uniref:Trimeric autotransporter adhesin YadA-like head domain-containing protein n=1 Tax=Chryseobacterium caseinilyticum TaxID=2771428 RepID=A0ABR8Z8Z5_9FLAO|nr:hypothetical protein [Chryseobacterium caseinilyticum]MBD8081705.1 hypothetical protein [Chryseobacterium caseinilyticum]